VAKRDPSRDQNRLGRIQLLGEEELSTIPIDPRTGHSRLGLDYASEDCGFPMSAKTLCTVLCRDILDWSAFIGGLTLEEV
jgi:hypothetical protein